MLVPWMDWTHMTKIDPDKSLLDGTTYAALADTGTAAHNLGGWI